MNIFIIDYINILSVQLGTTVFIICPLQFQNSRILESASIIYPGA